MTSQASASAFRAFLFFFRRAFSLLDQRHGHKQPPGVRGGGGSLCATAAGRPRPGARVAELECEVLCGAKRGSHRQSELSVSRRGRRQRQRVHQRHASRSSSQGDPGEWRLHRERSCTRHWPVHALRYRGGWQRQCVYCRQWPQSDRGSEPVGQLVYPDCNFNHDELVLSHRNWLWTQAETSTLPTPAAAKFWSRGLREEAIPKRCSPTAATLLRSPASPWTPAAISM